LNNKVEFLKSSLAGEQQRYSELEGKLAAMRSRLEETQQEMKRRQAAAQESASNAVALAEKNMRAQVDDALQESSQLQARSAALQSQLGDALNDVAIAKRREDNYRSDVVQLQAKLEAVTSQLNGLGNQSDALMEAMKREEAADAKRASAEALMRRLDNERSYLRSQLTSEVTLKLELQTTLDQATKNLGELKQTYAAEREAAEVYIVL
jgi:chromosome segregation ATPase